MVLLTWNYGERGVLIMKAKKHIKTLTGTALGKTLKYGGCGECQTSCQSACKTSCTVGNQACEH
jgi:predicted ribosomally synthesized six-cysteine peptide SCIFF